MKLRIAYVVLWIIAVAGGLWAFTSASRSEVITRFAIILPVLFVMGVIGVQILGPKFFERLPEDATRRFRAKLRIEEDRQDS